MTTVLSTCPLGRCWVVIGYLVSPQVRVEGLRTLFLEQEQFLGCPSGLCLSVHRALLQFSRKQCVVFRYCFAVLDPFSDRCPGAACRRFQNGTPSPCRKYQLSPVRRSPAVQKFDSILLDIDVLIQGEYHCVFTPFSYYWYT